MTSTSFNKPVPDPVKAPQPPTQQCPLLEETPGRSILVPGIPKARFQWPPECLWPFGKYDRNVQSARSE